MNLEEYFREVFTKPFIGSIYWPTFVLELLLSVVVGGIGIAVFVALFGSVIAVAMTAGTQGALTGSSVLANLGAVLGGLIVFTIVFGLILMYLSDVIAVFVIKRIQATDSKTKKSLGFFDFLGQSFGPGLLLFLGQIIYMISMGIIMAIISLVFSLIPVVGAILAIIIDVIISIYAVTGSLILVGEIGTGKSFGTALGDAFAKPFRKIKLYGYTFVLGIVAAVIGLVIGLLGMIPILGWIFAFFGLVGLAIYSLTISYNYAKE